jgi:pyruvate/2-oxoglutarate dehydrogenase complex dihydrolipoamide acyltransferase (E2) component
MDMTEGTILQWYRSVGDHVIEGEALAEVETSKVTAELEAPVSGVLSQLVAAVGDTAQVFDIVAVITEDD